MAFLFVNFRNKLTCDSGRKGQLNSHWLEKIHHGVLGEVEQGTGSAPCIGCDFLYLFCRDWQHLDVADSTVSRAVRHHCPLGSSSTQQANAALAAGPIEKKSTVNFG